MASVAPKASTDTASPAIMPVAANGNGGRDPWWVRVADRFGVTALVAIGADR